MMMEAIQNIEARALKPSLRREILMKATQQVFSDDVFCLNSGSVAAGEEFSVDDLLDLSNENFEDEEEEKDSISVSSQDRVGDDNPNYSAGNVEAFPAVPVDDWKDLEWVSQFVDDSVSEISMLYPAGYKTGTAEEKRSDGAAEPQSPDCLRRLLEKTPAKARSKRPRIAKPRWCRPFGSPSITDSSSTSSFSSSASTPALALVPASLHAMEQLVCSLGQQFQLQKPPRKRQKKNRAGSGSGAATVPQTQRRCSHCQVQKTPQWRTGPLGAKTLCNACGVRYKSGRLFPEYRPACSPTFSVEVHSNSHRKVLEMRRKKETCGPDSGLSQMVPSC